MPLISSIPARYKDGFKELANLREDQFAALKEALAAVSPDAFIEELAEKVSLKRELERNSISEIFLSISGLVPLLEEPEQLTEIVEDTTAICNLEKLVEQNQLSTFRERLSILLENKKIFYASKAEDLLFETENLFISGKIITDLRPIFDLDPEKSPEAGVIMHTLHIHYHADAAAPHKDIYLTLDSNDIQALMDALIRAEKKEEGLKRLISNAGMINLKE